MCSWPVIHQTDEIVGFAPVFAKDALLTVKDACNDDENVWNKSNKFPFGRTLIALVGGPLNAALVASEVRCRFIGLQKMMS